MEKPSEQNFQLLKLKQEKNGGLTIEWHESAAHGDTVTQNKIKQTSNDIPHPDLINVLKMFKRFVGDVIFADQNNLTIDVKGVAVSGENDSRGVIIMSTMDSLAGLPIVLNTHRIKLIDEVYGFEPELETGIDMLETEAYEYVYAGKKAQLELFDETQE